MARGHMAYKKIVYKRTAFLIVFAAIILCTLAAPVSAAEEWYLETVDSTGSVGTYTSLVLNTSGSPCISYYNGSPSQDLKYAWHDGTTWHNETVDTGGNVGTYSSLALNTTTGYPCISYRDNSKSVLKYAWHDGTAWNTKTVDSTCNAGQYTSLALNASGYPCISYYDGTNTDLKYAWHDGTAWHIETIDSTDNVGSYTSLVLNSTTGYPCISYYNGTNGDLKYAWHDGTAWHNETVDSSDNVGYYTSLALNASGYPCISYYDGTNTDLKYAWHDGTTWHTETVDSGGSVGTYTSLVLNTSGYPCISYYDGTNTDLKYAWHDGTAWHTETIDSTDNVGTYTSLALNTTTGYPCISYYNASNTGLKYAEKGLPPAAGFTSNVTTGAIPLAVQFNDTSTGEIVAWDWDFGDGAAHSSSQHPAHTYTTPGSYSVSLIVSKFGSSTLTKTDYIAVTPGAGFTANITTGTAPLGVQFNDTSTGSPTTWNWTFGDGGRSTEQNATHTYTAAGTYTVSLNVSIANLCNTSTRTDYITVTVAPQVSSPSGGGASETAAAVVSNLKTGESAKFTFDKSAVYMITLTAKADTGTILLTAEKKNSLPGDIPSPDASIYQYIDVNLYKATEEDISQAVIEFDVARSWLTENGYSTHDVVLFCHHGGEWQHLPTEFIKEENGWMHYRATSSGLSYFAIVYEEGGTVTGAPEYPATGSPTPAPITPAATTATPAAVAAATTARQAPLAHAPVIAAALMVLLWGRKR